MFKIRRSGILRPRKIYCGKSMDRALLVPCFDLNSSAPYVFSRADATNSPYFDFELWKVCRATCATPGYFKPFPLTLADGKTSCLAVDGGLVMNNPTAAVTHVLHNKRDFPNVSGVEDLLVLSIGNGQPGVISPHRRLVSPLEIRLLAVQPLARFRPDHRIPRHLRLVS